jgi:hypothetical protein
VIHTQSQRQLDQLFPDPGNYELLCRALGGSSAAAPVIARDIGYEDAAREALDGATRIAAESAVEQEVEPLHILLGLLRPWSFGLERAATPDEAALALAATGLGEARLRELLRVSPRLV